MGALRSRPESGFSLVELLVVVSLLAIVGTAITTVILSTERAEQYQRGLQEVIDDGRLSLSRIRRELRGARRVLHTSCATAGPDCAPSDRLHFWVDQNQDSIPQASELICYTVSEFEAGRFEVLRWTEAMLASPPPADPCHLDARPPGAQVLARTLINSRPFVAFDRDPSPDPFAAPTRAVEVVLELEVASPRGPSAITVEGTIRIRNVE